jgi:hypothetical protein
MKGGVAVWRTTMHSQAVEVDSRLRRSIEQQIRHALGGLGQHIGHVHIRLYGETGGSSLCTCYIRVDLVPSGGVALGETAGDPSKAVARTVARIAVAVERHLEERRPAVRGAAPAALMVS